MADLGALLEAERRGILPADKLGALNEARSRGLVPGGKQHDMSDASFEQPSFGEKLTKGANEVGASMADQLIGAMQGTTPIVRDVDGKDTRKRLGTLMEADSGPVYVDSKTGEWVPVDPNAMVVLRDGSDMVVFERNEKTDDGVISTIGRLLGIGSLTNPVARAGGAIAPKVGSRLQALDAAGVTPTATLATGNKGLARVEQGLQQFVGSTGQVTKSATRTVDEIAGSAERVASKLGDVVHTDDAGGIAQQGVKRFTQQADLPASTMTPVRKSSFKSKSDVLYKAADDAIPGDTPVDASNTRNALGELLSTFKGNPELGKTLQGSFFERLAKAVSNSDRLSFDELRAFRSEIGELVGDHKTVVKASTKRLKKLYAALSADQRAVATTHSPEALKAFNRADKFFKAGSQRIENALSLIGDVKSPEQAFDKIMKFANVRGGNIKVLRALQRSLPKDEWDSIASAVVRRMGMKNAGGVSGADAEFGVNEFVSKFAGLSGKGKDALFGASNPLRSELDNLINVAGFAKDIDSLRNAPNTGAVVLQGLLAGGLFLNAPKTAFAALAANVTARMMGSAKVVRWMAGLKSASNSRKAMSAHFARLKSVSDTLDPELREHVIRFSAAVPATLLGL